MICVHSHLWQGSRGRWALVPVEAVRRCPSAMGVDAHGVLGVREHSATRRVQHRTAGQHSTRRHLREAFQVKYCLEVPMLQSRHAFDRDFELTEPNVYKLLRFWDIEPHMLGLPAPQRKWHDEAAL